MPPYIADCFVTEDDYENVWMYAVIVAGSAFIMFVVAAAVFIK